MIDAELQTKYVEKFVCERTFSCIWCISIFRDMWPLHCESGSLWLHVAGH